MGIRLSDKKCNKCNKQLLEIKQYKDFTKSEKEHFLYCIKCERRKAIESNLRR